MAEQYQLNFEAQISTDALIQTMSASEIFDSLSVAELGRFGEDRRVELKRASLHVDELAKYYSMFSNTSPDGGVLILGVENDGSPSGCVTLSTNQLNTLEKFHLQRCPQAKPTLRRLEFVKDGVKDFIVVIYLPYVGKLCETSKRDSYIRYGDSIRKMSPEEKSDFRATRNEIQFELEPCNLPWPDAFEAEIVRNICDKFCLREDIHGRSPEEILEIKHLGIRTKTGFVPNKALALLAARDPRQIIPGCRIRVMRFPGLEEGEGKTFNPVIDRFVEGNIVNLIQRGSALIDNVIFDLTWLNDEGKFVNTKEYPRDAWIEALVNAVVHRSYVFSGADVTVKLFDDRMEIESPGGFCPPVTADNIYEVRASRNPFLMDAMYLLDFVKMAREGTRRMRESMATLGLPAPTFAQEAVHGLLVRVTLRNNSKYRKRAGATDVVTAIGTRLWSGLDEKARKILELVVRNGSINVSEAQQALNCSWPSAKRTLIGMAKQGLIAHLHNSTDRDTRAKFVLNSK